MQSKSPRASLYLFQNNNHTPQAITSRRFLMTQCLDQTSSRHLINIRSNNTLLSFRPETPKIHSNKIIQQPNQHRNSTRRRTALPSQLQTQISSNQIRALLSPTQLTSINRKINFTYKTSTNNNNLNSLNTYTSSPSLTKVQSKLLEQLSKKKEKKIKNKLCSKEFSFAYVPQQVGMMKFSNYSVGTKKISFIQQMQKSAKRLSKKDSSIKMISQSKMASTTATQSFYADNQMNDFSTQVNSNNRQNCSSLSAFKNNSNNSLLERIPQGKQLGKTVILPNYSFGGIIEQEYNFKTFFSQKQGKSEYLRSNKCLPKQWNNHVKGLIDHEGSQNLKHSIHCGPQIRLQNHKFEMLNGFGRQIKESTLSFYQ